MKIFHLWTGITLMYLLSALFGQTLQAQADNNIASKGVRAPMRPAAQVPSSSNGGLLISADQISAPVEAAEPSPDGRFLKIEQFGKVSMWDLTGGRPLEFDNVDVTRVTFARDSKHVLVASGNDSELWDLDVRRKVKTLSGARIGLGGITDGVYTLAFSPDGRLAATGNNSTIAVWNLSTGEAINTFKQDDNQITEIRFFPDGRTLLVRSARGKLRLLTLPDGKVIDEFNQTGGFGYISLLSENGRWLTVQGASDRLDLFDLASHRIVKSFSDNGLFTARTVAFSPKSSHLLVGGSLLDLETLELTIIAKPNGVIPGCFSADGSLAALLDTGTHEAVLWDVKSRSEKLRVAAQMQDVTSLAFCSGDQFLVTTSSDGTSRIVDLNSVARTCSLTTFKTGEWVVMDSAGRFDVSDVNALRNLRLSFAKKPSEPMPLEVAVHDYFEPDLLRRFVSKEVFPPLKDLQTVDLIRPVVEIQDIQPKSAQIDTVEVTVKVTDPHDTHEAGKPDQNVSGVYDLRVCCDGKLVGYAPAHSGEVPLQNGQAVLVFDVPLSHHRASVEFTAYAFNHDRIKSVTAAKRYGVNLPNTGLDRAYIITIGVDKFESPALTPLHYAPDDARMISQTLVARLSEQTLAYAGVINIPLIYSDEISPGLVRPTKNNLKTVLDVLAGRPFDRPTLKGFPSDLVKQLRKVGPDDLLLIFFATHGLTDNQGHFYLFPCDTGPSEEIDELLPKGISGDELSDWLRDIVAGETVLILDVCHSGAIAGKRFQAAPLGNRGLGQLSYEKAMRILAATQDDNDASASGQRRHGLLTLALIEEGINNKGAADPYLHNSISLKDWLEYGRSEVPELFLKEIPHGNRKLQRPLLLDFSQSQDNRLIAFFYK